MLLLLLSLVRKVIVFFLFLLEMSLEQKFNRMHAKYTSNEFRTTGKIIKQYGDPFNLDSSTDSKLKTFHY